MTIEQIAMINGWTVAETQPDAHYTRFVKDTKIIDVWQTTGTLRFIPFPYAKAEYYRDNTEEDFNRLFETL